MKRETIILILAVGLLASCNSAKHVQRSTTTVDSSVIQENKFLKESITGLNRTIERLTLDSQAVIVEFDTIHARDTFTRVVFKEGKIQTVQGPVRKIIQIDKRSTQERDSLAEVNSVLIDSLAYYKAQKAVKIETKDKKVKRGVPWWIIIIGFIAGTWLEYRFKWYSWIQRRLFG